MSALAFHPRHPGWLRLITALDTEPGDPPALMGLDDLDPDVVNALAHRTDKETHR